jgi:hypothetical protein
VQTLDVVDRGQNAAPGMLGRLQQQQGDALVRTNFPIDSLAYCPASAIPETGQYPDFDVRSSPEREDRPVVTFTVTIPGRSAWTMAESVTLRA